MGKDIMVALFATTAGFTVSGILSNLYRLIVRKPENNIARAGSFRGDGRRRPQRPARERRCQAEGEILLAMGVLARRRDQRLLELRDRDLRAETSTLRCRRTTNIVVIPGRATRQCREGKGTQVERERSIYPPGFPSLGPLALRAVLAGNDNEFTAPSASPPPADGARCRRRRGARRRSPARAPAARRCRPTPDMPLSRSVWSGSPVRIMVERQPSRVSSILSCP